MKRRYIIIMILTFFITSCDKEVVKIKGHIEGLNDSRLMIRMEGLSGNVDKVLNSCICENGEFNFKLKDIKPPVKLILNVNDSLESDIWVGEYGVITMEGKCNHAIFECKVIGSFFCHELQRMNKNLNKMYIAPIKEKQIEVSRLKELSKLGELSEIDDMYLAKLKKEIKIAYRLRKKSILKTVRKNTQSPVAIALMCQEYERLTAYQKKECLKYLSRTFADTGLNWQMKN